MSNTDQPQGEQSARVVSNKFFWPPMSLSIPIALILFTVFGTFFSFQYSIRLSYKAVEQNGIKTLTRTMTRLQSTVEFLVQKNEKERIRTELVALGTHTEIEVALLLDNKKQVRASLSQVDIGKNLNNLSPVQEQLPVDFDDILQKARAHLVGSVAINPGGTLLTGVYPVVMSVNPADLRPTQIGILFIQQNLAHEQAVQHYKTKQHSLQFGGYLLLLAGLLWVFLHFGVARRANRLVHLTEQLASGDLSARAEVNGKDEFAHIGTALDEMSVRLQNHQHQLTENEARLNEAQHIAKVGSWELNLTTGNLFWTDEIYNLFEIDKKQFGATYEAFLNTIHPDDRDIVNAGYTQSLEDRTPYVITHRLLMNDGRIIWVEEHCNTDFDADGKALISRGTVQDITERKLAENRLEKVNEELELRVEQRTIDLKAARDEAERANIAKSEFLSRMSHELRTPLNAILGFGQMLELDADGFNENQRDNIQEILEGGRHLLKLINEILDLAKIESGKMEISMKEISVTEVLQRCISLINPQAEARQLQIIDHVSSNNHSVFADLTRFKQALLNLLSNAVKYNRKLGSITLHSETIDQKRLRISVTDTGDGLSNEQADKLFTSFERMHSATIVEGVGIGLVITKHLMELMGGTIGVESEPGKGSIFWIELELFTTTNQDL